MDPLQSLAVGVAKGGVESALNFGLNSISADQAYRRQKNLMDKQYKMNLQAQRDTPKAQVDGLRSAGLSPAIAGGNVSSPLGVSGMSVNPVAPVNAQIGSGMDDVLKGATVEKTGAEVGNISENTELTKLKRLYQVEETTAQEILNNREKAVDSYAKWAWISQYGEDAYKKWCEQNNGEEPNLGTLIGEKNIGQFLNDMKKIDNEALGLKLDGDVLNLELADDTVKNALAKMPPAQLAKIKAETFQLGTLAQLHSSEKVKTDADRKLVETRIDEVTYSIAQKLIDDPAVAAYVGNDKAVLYGLINKMAGFAGRVAEQGVGIAMNKKQLGKKIEKTVEHYGKDGSFSGGYHETTSGQW